MRPAAILAFSVFTNLAWGQMAPLPLISNGDISVTSDDLRAYMLRVPEKNRGEALSSYEWIGKAMDSVFENRVLAAEARRLGYDKDPVVALRLKQSEEALLAQVWADRFRKDMKLPDLKGRAQELYMVGKDKHVEPELVMGNIVTISTKGRTKEMAREIAESVRKLALAGTSMEDLAATYSDDPAAKRHKGRLLYVKRSDLEPGVADAAFSIKPREVTPPIETESGYAIFKLEKKLTARQRPFDEVKENIIAEEADRYRGLAEASAVAKLKNPATIVVETKNIESLRVPIDPKMIDRAHEEMRKAMAAREAAAIQ